MSISLIKALGEIVSKITFQVISSNSAVFIVFILEAEFASVEIIYRNVRNENYIKL